MKSADDTTVTVAGKEIDLRKAVPLKVKDFRRLQEMGVDLTNLNPNDFNSSVKMVLVVLQKCDPEIKEADVEDMEVTALAKIGQFVAKEGYKTSNIPT